MGWDGIDRHGRDNFGWQQRQKSRLTLKGITDMKAKLYA
jgi:hypothetical protein